MKREIEIDIESTREIENIADIVKEHQQHKKYFHLIIAHSKTERTMLFYG
jgi:hypothetical protein